MPITHVPVNTLKTGSFTARWLVLHSPTGTSANAAFIDASSVLMFTINLDKTGVTIKTPIHFPDGLKTPGNATATFWEG